MRSPYPAIRLRTDGPDIVVEIDHGIKNRDGESYIEVIREKLNGWPEIEICSEVLDGGIEKAKDWHYNGQFLKA